MAAYVVENEGVLALDQEALSNVEVIETELSVKHGRASQSTDGRIDLLVTYSEEILGIIELKLGQLNADHLFQLEDYLQERDAILKACPDALSSDATATPKWVGVLVGSSIDTEIAKKLTAGHIAHGCIPIAALTIQRYLGADNQVYVVTDTYFSGLTAARDTSKYLFQGRTFGKGRLVLEVVRRHVDTNPSIGFQGLLEAFPKHCQGSMGVFSTEQDAREIHARTGRARHFVSPSDLVTLSDSVVSVCSQWGIGNIERFVAQAKTLGYDISPTNR
jgi:hypothetical protein